METEQNLSRAGTDETPAQALPGQLLARARASVRRMRLVGNQPAIDLVNTESGPPHGEPDDDSLGDYLDFVAWAEYAGVLSLAEAERLAAAAQERPDVAADVATRVLELRSALHELFDAIAHDRSGSADAADRLLATEREGLQRAALVRRDSTFDWTWPDPEDLARPLWLVAHGAVELLRTGPLDRLKECGGCRFLFLDETKNKSRRWCAMSDCGTASKMRSYVARRSRRRAERRAAKSAR